LEFRLHKGALNIERIYSIKKKEMQRKMRRCSVMKQVSNIKMLVLSLVVFAILAASVLAAGQAPEGATKTETSSSRMDANVASSDGAVAGNVSGMTVTGYTVTQTWAGYYGNVTGTIKLDDAANKTLYDWTLTEPSGEIYAVNESLVWTNVGCFNFSSTGAGALQNLTKIETLYGLGRDDVDGFDETFNSSNGQTTFYVGSNTIASTTTCRQTSLYDNTEADPGALLFREVLLYDRTGNNIIYTAILQNDTSGFNAKTIDFELLVPDNGHNADTNPTTYYFYVELE
jgi:hypothetical protein